MEAFAVIEGFVHGGWESGKVFGERRLGEKGGGGGCVYDMLVGYIAVEVGTSWERPRGCLGV